MSVYNINITCITLLNFYNGQVGKWHLSAIDHVHYKSEDTILEF